VLADGSGHESQRADAEYVTITRWNRGQRAWAAGVIAITATALGLAGWAGYQAVVHSDADIDPVSRFVLHVLVGVALLLAAIACVLVLWRAGATRSRPAERPPLTRGGRRAVALITVVALPALVAVQDSAWPRRTGRPRAPSRTTRRQCLLPRRASEPRPVRRGRRWHVPRRGQRRAPAVVDRRDVL
jgi:succinate dehydrogenase hydrophobic anchor subunit